MECRGPLAEKAQVTPQRFADPTGLRESEASALRSTCMKPGKEVQGVERRDSRPVVFNPDPFRVQVDDNGAGPCLCGVPKEVAEHLREQLRIGTNRVRNAAERCLERGLHSVDDSTDKPCEVH